VRYLERFPRPLLLSVAVLAAYALSLGGGFLNYDDGWLVEDNTVLRRDALKALPAIWWDLRPDTRHTLGSEYLPVRDTFVWLQVQLFGLWPQALRAVGLALYIVGVLLMRAYLVTALPDRGIGEMAAWLFALHPLHVESAAWLAGQKDLLALAGVAAALVVYARGRALWAVPVLTLTAVLGKSVAVVLPGLLLLHDFLVARRPRWAAVATSAAVAAAVLAVHVHVGRVVGMMAALPGGSRLSAGATMGPVWAQELLSGFLPLDVSIHHEVSIRGAADAVGWGAYGALVLLAVAAAWAYRRNDRRWLWALGWFILPLLPTSQVLVPLQNLRADRYLLLAVLGPCVAIAAFSTRTGHRALVVGVLAIACALTTVRAHVFASSERLWEDAVAKTKTAALPPYQLGLALEKSGQVAEAEAAFRLALSRSSPSDDVACSVASNLSTLLAGQNRLVEALAVLKPAVARCPQNPKVLGNLAEITARAGDHEKARRLFEEAMRQFPAYTTARRNYEKRYGPMFPHPPGLREARTR
jgi:tetratricopeptide (TPR) repeat protein